MLDGSPREIFKHREELEMLGLAVPQITYVVDKLRESGIPIEENPITVEEAKRAILKAMKKG